MFDRSNPYLNRPRAVLPGDPMDPNDPHDAAFLRRARDAYERWAELDARAFEMMQERDSLFRQWSGVWQNMDLTVRPKF